MLWLKTSQQLLNRAFKFYNTSPRAGGKIFFQRLAAIVSRWCNTNIYFKPSLKPVSHRNASDEYRGNLKNETKKFEPKNKIKTLEEFQKTQKTSKTRNSWQCWVFQFRRFCWSVLPPWLLVKSSVWADAPRFRWFRTSTLRGWVLVELLRALRCLVSIQSTPKRLKTRLLRWLVCLQLSDKGKVLSPSMEYVLQQMFNYEQLEGK